MINMGTLFSVRSEREQQALRRNSRAAHVVLTLSSLMVSVAFLGVNVLILWQAWRTSEWIDFWPDAVIFGLLALLPLTLFAAGIRGAFRPPDTGAAGPSVAFREAILGSDQSVVPLVLLQPAAIQIQDLPTWPLRLGPLRRPFGASPSSFMVAVTTAAFMPFIFLLCAIPAMVGDLIASPAGPYAIAIIALGVAPLVVLVLVLVIAATAAARRNKRYVLTDDQGLRWEDGRGRRRTEMFIPWAQIRSLTRTPFVASAASTGTASTATAGQRLAYMIDGGDTVLQWMIGPLAPPDEFSASELLLRLVVSRTGLPLRDISAFLGELAQAGRNASRVLENRVPAIAANKALIAALAAPTRRRRRWGWALYGLVVLLLLGVLYGGGAWLQQYQTQYFAGLPARVHAETPAAQSDLRGDVAPGWHGVGMDPSSGTYIASTAGYTLTGTAGEAMVALYAGGARPDGAFEVTAAQSGELTKDGGDGVGIVLRSDANGTDFLSFTVGYDGNWNLSRFNSKTGRSSDDWTYLTGGSSAAIYTGYGDENKLLVIARDKLFLFYVNDQFLGSYYARYDDLPSGGYAGVYLDDGSLTGRFTDFAVYPTPPLFALGDVVYNG